MKTIKSKPRASAKAPTKRSGQAEVIAETALPAHIQTERDAVTDVLRPIVDLLSSMLPDNMEVVLHDLTNPTNSIVAIINGHVSARAVGHPLLGGPRADKGMQEVTRHIGMPSTERSVVVKDYVTTTASGLELRSATCLYRDSTGTPFAALCMNVDTTILEMMQAWTSRQLGSAQRPEPAEHDAPPMDALMHEVIGEAIAKFGKPVSLMNKDEKTLAVDAMKKNGLFIVKGGVERAAKALGVSRFTVYNYLDELKRRETA